MTSKIKTDYNTNNVDFWINFHKTHLKNACKSLGLPEEALSWNQYQQYCFNTVFTEGNAPKENLFGAMIKALGGFQSIKANFTKVRVYPEQLVIKAHAKKEYKIANQEALYQLRLKTFEDVLSKVGPLNPTYKLPPRAKFLERNQHLIISDTHFGSDLKPEVGVRKYGIEEEARSLARIVVETVEHKVQYRKNTKIWTNLNGDIIQGNIHDPLNYDDISKQMVRAINILSQGIEILGANFPEVEINCASGNHDRNGSRHPDRAMQGKHNSWSFVIYHALKNRFAKHQNIKFNIPLTPFFTYKSFDAWYYGTHGDTMFPVPNPNGNINVKALENSVNSLNSRMNSPKYNVVFFGHVHSGMLLHLSNGTTLITNPPLVPTDEYGMSLNINPDSPTGQWLIESVPGHPVGDTRFVRVTEHDRQNPELSKVIDCRYWR
jgi:hypothetical protein